MFKSSIHALFCAFESEFNIVLKHLKWLCEPIQLRYRLQTNNVLSQIWHGIYTVYNGFDSYTSKIRQMYDTKVLDALYILKNFDPFQTGCCCGETLDCTKPHACIA
jgi:hypothetical protein